MAPKQGGTNVWMRRSRSSFQSLSPSSSLSAPRSSSAFSPAPIVRCTSRDASVSGSDANLGRLTGLKADDRLSELSLAAFATSYPPPPRVDSDNAALIQYVLILAMALQIPNYFQELSEILELHYHSFPVLIILGTFPSVFLRGKKHELQTSSGPKNNPFETSSKTIAEIQNYYQIHYPGSTNSQEEPLSPAKVTRIEFLGQTDEWGHFADFDESFAGERETANSFMTPASASSASLCTVVESENEG